MGLFSLTGFMKRPTEAPAPAVEEIVEVVDDSIKSALVPDLDITVEDEVITIKLGDTQVLSTAGDHDAAISKAEEIVMADIIKYEKDIKSMFTYEVIISRALIQIAAAKVALDVANTHTANKNKLAEDPSFTFTNKSLTNSSFERPGPTEREMNRLIALVEYSKENIELLGETVPKSFKHLEVNRDYTMFIGSQAVGLFGHAQMTAAMRTGNILSDYIDFTVLSEPLNHKGDRRIRTVVRGEEIELVARFVAKGEHLSLNTFVVSEEYRNMHGRQDKMLTRDANKSLHDLVGYNFWKDA